MIKSALKHRAIIFVFLTVLLVKILPQEFFIIMNSCESEYTGNPGRASFYHSLSILNSEL